ncbi:4-hydroxy-tetrahydrodipicolinate reductase [Leptospira levettii]|uniref:4-hydroxy-tetrahydrodipicolinate reductase n=2 Tax=Leptospira levettii TaxID=2023178 RepID=A0ABY2MLT9_9LEPT|nr:4-hydroxy-tetrahydrodipicolinate reductase [Leptospira levettii]PKA28245.1 4-hydroxy-tetrahydrodipicolinate reductase [Leptospira sp. mixed culture ATI2-C-A1]PJZ37982.1 4-hydroxy-tetrahydrodipicolinate reductase [Leptospira levettii]PJZ88238.1 4-hydroxy-tetrahydrodipicolinate reductase [Leptospira levettii]PKA01267.1 4-hydroxy-tetrahydrodipicolinate reductase [Leptospira levettii]TGK98557.1 4-hydroxy-tetrahydrodipicolinate reductase [Leptospira levettii]
MSKIKVGVIGAGGRMGKAIIQVLSISKKSVLSAAVVREGAIYAGFDSGNHAGIKETGILLSSDLQKANEDSDVLIDFSTHTGFESILNTALKNHKPLVIGTTGLTDSDKTLIKSASETIPIVFSPNMSVGVNLLFKLTEIAAKVLHEDFDIEVLDIHHRHKKDAPSGTAMYLKEVLLEASKRNEENVIYGRHGMYPERDQKEIAMHTMRAGEVVGEHTVYFFSPEERIEITHRAQDRKTFASGAVKAAEFLYGKSKGLYNMFDVLGI